MVYIVSGFFKRVKLSSHRIVNSYNKYKRDFIRKTLTLTLIYYMSDPLYLTIISENYQNKTIIELFKSFSEKLFFQLLLNVCMLLDVSV